MSRTIRTYPDWTEYVSPSWARHRRKASLAGMFARSIVTSALSSSLGRYAQPSPGSVQDKVLAQRTPDRSLDVLENDLQCRVFGEMERNRLVKGPSEPAGSHRRW